MLTIACCIVVGGAAQARAQSGAPLPGRVEISVGPSWMGGLALGSAAATETTSTDSTVPLFSSTSTLSSATGFEGRVGVRVTPAIEAQVSGSYGTPEFRISLSGDVEGASSITAVERMRQFTVSAGALVYVRRRGRLAPFVGGEVGYLRHLHENDALAETGRVVQLGGGVKYVWRSRDRGRLKILGLRADLRAALRARGAAFDDRLHASPSLGASLFVRF